MLKNGPFRAILYIDEWGEMDMTKLTTKINNFILLIIVLAVLISIFAPVKAITLSQFGMAAGLVLGQPGFTTRTPSAGQAALNTPRSIAVDPTTQKVFVADSDNNRVLRFSSYSSLALGAPAEAVLGQEDFAGTAPHALIDGMDNPSGVTVDSSGTLYVSDRVSNRILRFNNASSLGNGAPADGVLGQDNFTSQAPGTDPNHLFFPTGIYAINGTLWVSDTSNNRVLRFDNAAALPDGAAANGVLGQSIFTTNAYTASDTGMYAPVGLFVDSSGRLWVADRFNHRVLRFDNAASLANGAPATRVLGQVDFFHGQDDPALGRMGEVQGVSGDNQGRLYVADSTYNRVVIYENAALKNNIDPPQFVLGQPDSTTYTTNIDCSPASATFMCSPVHVFYDSFSDSVWVVDNFNHRVLNYSSLPEQPVVLAPTNGSLITNPNPTFSGTAQTGTIVKVWIGNTTVIPTTWTIYCQDTDIPATAWSCSSATPLPQGLVTYNVTAERAGNQSPFLDTPRTLTLDSIPPAQPSIIAPANGSVINDSTPTFSGTADSGVTIRVWIWDAAAQPAAWVQACTTQAAANGSWSCTSTITLPDCVVTFNATAIDVAGNSTLRINPSPTFTLDTIPPSRPLVSLPVNGSLTNNPRPTFSGSAGSGLTVRVYYQHNSTWTLYCSGSTSTGTSWSCSSSSPLPEGLVPFNAIATDAANNHSPDLSPIPSITVDSVAPAVPLISTPAAGSQTFQTVPLFSGTAEPSSSVVVKEGLVTLCSTSAAANGTWSCSPLSPLSRAAHTVGVTAADAASNTSLPASRSFEIRYPTYLPSLGK
jgi:sugar lactone lactonase YvrE